MNAPRRLIIDLGDLPGLVAAAISERPDLTVLYHPRVAGSNAVERATVVAAHAERFGCDGLIVDELESILDALPDANRSEDLAELGIMLLQAARAARRTGCRVIVWPVHVGEDVGSAARLLERALTLGDLLNPTADPQGLSIQTPLLDLADWQVLDLAIRLDVPLRLARFCERSPANPCAACPSCRRWFNAARRLDLPGWVFSTRASTAPC